MPALEISTNVKIDEVHLEPIFSQASDAVASIIGRPKNVRGNRTKKRSPGTLRPVAARRAEPSEPTDALPQADARRSPPSLSSHEAPVVAALKMVMVVLKGSVPISFTGTEDPAAFAQLISMGGINSVVKRKLIKSLGDILQTHLSIPPTRFFCHVIDTTAGRPPRPKL
ncbi:hypothetical protein Cgig2_002032 [Carnegiea gigantea]|uniref:Uncharacterized protein n=1 Tax=Carnegiea gigantea TaxID=171969 RepID=A0A9Q1GR54_9CARY|nr:hypothetical protein Cgig2_002032 [Carnegiea gigantea]